MGLAQLAHHTYLYWAPRLKGKCKPCVKQTRCSPLPLSSSSEWYFIVKVCGRDCFKSRHGPFTERHLTVPKFIKHGSVSNCLGVGTRKSLLHQVFRNLGFMLQALGCRLGPCPYPWRGRTPSLLRDGSLTLVCRSHCCGQECCWKLVLTLGFAKTWGIFKNVGRKTL